MFNEHDPTASMIEVGCNHSTVSSFCIVRRSGDRICLAISSMDDGDAEVFCGIVEAKRIVDALLAAIAAAQAADADN